MKFFRSSNRIHREASEWLARLGGGAGESDHARFRAWYEADRRNAEAYDRMAVLWSASGKLSMPEPVDAAESAGNSRRFGYAIAASVVAVAAIALLLMRGPLFGNGAQPPSVYATSHGELREVGLPDGSRVMLDAGSRIEVLFSSAERRLILREGRARFTVAHESRPFVVEAGSDQIVATGTVFDVSLLNDRLSVVLLEGSVEVRKRQGSGAPTHRLAAGHRLIAQGDGRPISTPAARSDTAWARRMLEFDDLPLAEAVATANRYGRVRIRIADDEVGRLRVTGAYRAGDTTGLARSLAAAFDLHLRTESDGTLVLSRTARTR